MSKLRIKKSLKVTGFVAMGLVLSNLSAFAFEDFQSLSTSLPLGFVAKSVLRGGETGGGGDLCEDRIKVIRDDIKTWIKNGGSIELRLAADLSNENYVREMMRSFDAAKVRCVGSQDEGFPVMVNGTPKVCRFDRAWWGGDNITCDLVKFTSLSDAGQYVLIHHEYAGLAGVEPPQGDDSDYSVSNQIAEYLENQTIKKLAVKQIMRTERISNIGAVFVQDNTVPSLGEAYRDPSGLIWGGVLRNGNMLAGMNYAEAAERCRVGGARLPTREEFQKLASYLGLGSIEGYSPFQKNKEEVLPDLAAHNFWSSTPSWIGMVHTSKGSFPSGLVSSDVYLFGGSNVEPKNVSMSGDGALTWYVSRSESAFARCVVRPGEAR